MASEELNLYRQELSTKDFYVTVADFSSADLEQFRVFFDRYDGKKDGYLDADEICRACAKLGINDDQPVTIEQAEELVTSFDIDRDGKLSVNEFIFMMARVWQMCPGEVGSQAVETSADRSRPRALKSFAKPRLLRCPQRQRRTFKSLVSDRLTVTRTHAHVS